MIYLPNNFERYTSALRIVIHLSILKNGLCRRHLDSLKKIYAAEAFFYKNERSAYSLYELAFPILSTSQTLLLNNKKDLKFSLYSEGVYLLNKRLFTLLLLELCSSAENIKIIAENEKIIINTLGNIKSSLSIVKALKGCFFYESLSQKSVIVIPAQNTEEKPLKCETEWHYIFDRFSPVNLYFG